MALLWNSRVPFSKEVPSIECNKLFIPQVKTPALSLTVFLVALYMIKEEGSVGGGRYAVDNIDFSS